ncbi:DMT family transporter [Nocardioides speluncae]|uniref:DMT family transporter n=1 Tax=Nocardioides speluncae TaxID=2670337 RepID=UPI000D69C6A4|nr:DMT family transporter [Nocardioides speluncae]
MSATEPHLEATTAPAEPARRTVLAIAAGAVACALVGASVPVTGMLDDYPLMGGQALRYGLGALLLLTVVRIRRQSLPVPTPRDLRALVAVVLVGQLGFNAFLLISQRYAEPGLVAAVLGGTPLVLVVLAPLLARRRPGTVALLGATIVVAGIVTLSGGGSWHGPGLALAVLTMLCEVGFTLLAIGVIERMGGLAVSTWSCLIAAGMAAVLAALGDGWRVPTAREAVALLVLGWCLSGAFLLWFFAVGVLQADRAGTLVGLMPVAGLAGSVLLGAQALTVVAVAGAALVALGCMVGLWPSPSRDSRFPDAVP